MTSTAAAIGTDMEQEAPATPPRTPRRRKFMLWALLLLLVGLVAATIFFWPRPFPAAPALPATANAETGRYLATAGNCEACHTVPGGQRFAGGVRFETPFGILYSTNVTSDRQQGIGGWTFEQFYNAVKYGMRPDGSHLYPAFPYTAFSQMSDADIGSLYLYFRTIPASAATPPANEMSFPFDNRGLLHFWKRMFFDPQALEPVAGQSAEWNRGAYLVRAVAHCGACHTPRGWLGEEDNGRFLQGGTYTDRVASGAYRLWSAVDLTPGPQGLGNWSRDDIAGYLRTGLNSHNVVHGPMAEVFASTRQMSPQDAQAIATYLTGIPGSSERWGRWFNPSGFDEGQLVYTVHCATCHLPDGRGDRVLGVPLAGNPVVQAPDPASLINVILYGPQLPPAPFSANRTVMRPYGRRLSDEDVATLATFVRNSFGNRAGAVTTDQVRRQR